MRNRTENQMTLALIRHGETKANEEHRYLGKTDESLSEKGIKTLLSYKTKNYYPKINYLFSSPMKRCIETAKILYPQLNPIIIPEWTEMNFGQFEYKNYQELKNDAKYQEWIDSGGTLDFPEGESRKDFILRCKNGFIKMCNKLSLIEEQTFKAPLSTGIIVHGGTIMALLSSYEGKNYFDYQVPNGKGYLCEVKNYYNISLTNNNNIQIKASVKI